MTSIVAQDLMTADVLTVRDDTTLKELASFCRDKRITGAPVRDAKEKIVGVVSLVDHAPADAERPAPEVASAASDFYVRNWESLPKLREFHPTGEPRRVRDVMSPEIFAVGPFSTVRDIARTMLRHHVHRLLVLEEDRLLGVLTTTDLLRVLAGDDVVELPGGSASEDVAEKVGAA